MLLLRFARSKLGANMISWFFAHFSLLLPVKRVYESDRLIAFRHPRPSYPVHILLVPKKAIPGIDDLKPVDNGLLLEIMNTAQNLAEKIDPKNSHYRLVLNAGAYQDVPQLHFHLVAGNQETSEEVPIFKSSQFEAGKLVGW